MTGSGVPAAGMQRGFCFVMAVTLHPSIVESSDSTLVSTATEMTGDETSPAKKWEVNQMCPYCKKVYEITEETYYGHMDECPAWPKEIKLHDGPFVQPPPGFWRRGCAWEAYAQDFVNYTPHKIMDLKIDYIWIMPFCFTAPATSDRDLSAEGRGNTFSHSFAHDMESAPQRPAITKDLCITPHRFLQARLGVDKKMKSYQNPSLRSQYSVNDYLAML
eukprot:g16459.t1